MPANPAMSTTAPRGRKPPPIRFEWERHLRRCDMPPTTRLVALVLATYADPNGESWPSQVTLAKEIDVSERTVRTALAWLREHGWLTRIASGSRQGVRQSSDRYRLTVPDDFVDQFRPAAHRKTGRLPPDHRKPASAGPDGTTGNPLPVATGTTTGNQLPVA